MCNLYKHRTSNDSFICTHVTPADTRPTCFVSLIIMAAVDLEFWERETFTYRFASPSVRKCPFCHDVNQIILIICTVIVLLTSSSTTKYTMHTSYNNITMATTLVV